MPNVKSAEKRVRQNVTRRDLNRRRRSQMRTEIKRFRQLLSEKKIEDARGMLREVHSVIDRSAQNGIIHSNTAARYKSRLTKYLNGVAS
ncbi:MAG: 30S ribosomal protein S20 [Acidobacteria bacterium]|nr:30S ribosomal protein S20 [Acidobacteriota bacterium]